MVYFKVAVALAAIARVAICPGANACGVLSLSIGDDVELAGL
jgi:hypothetical protein